MLNASKAPGMTNMPPMPLVMGSMVPGEPKTARGIGAFLHFVVMGTVMFGLAYGAPFTMPETDGSGVGRVIDHPVYGVVVALVYQGVGS